MGLTVHGSVWWMPRGNDKDSYSGIKSARCVVFDSGAGDELYSSVMKLKKKKNSFSAFHAPEFSIENAFARRAEWRLRLATSLLCQRSRRQLMANLRE